MFRLSLQAFLVSSSIRISPPHSLTGAEAKSVFQAKPLTLMRPAE